MSSVACSGAVIEDIISKNTNYEGQVNDGLRRDERDDTLIKSGFLPGYIGQLEFIVEYQPSIITISTVGNDIGFGNKIKRCWSQTPASAATKIAWK
jgi:hypothetical protein